MEKVVKRIYEKPTIIKAQVRLQAVTAIGNPTGPSGNASNP
jgi:hypothetical protein